MSIENRTFQSAQVKTALRKLADSGVKFRRICLEIGGDTFYNRVQGRLRNDYDIPLSFLQPIIDKAPQFKTFLEDEDGAEMPKKLQAPNAAEKDPLETRLDELMGEMTARMGAMQKRLDEIGDGDKWKDEYIALLKKVAGVE